MEHEESETFDVKAQHPPVRLSALDALRGLAAAGVVLFHFADMFLVDIVARAPGPLRLVWYNLFTLVDLFFVISGFIFAHVYLGPTGELRAGTTARSYAVARFARLYPLHVVGLVAVAAIVLIQQPLFGGFAPPENRYTTRNFLLNLVFLQGSGLETAYSFDSPSWSLTAEALCYFLFYLISARSTGRIVPWSLGIIGLAVLSQWAFAQPQLPLKLAKGMAGFFAGVIAWRYKEVLISRNIMLSLLLLIAGLALAKLGGARVRLDYGIRLSLLAWPLLVLVILRAPLSALLDLAPFQLLGDLSFSVYLVHVPVMLLFLALNGGASFDPHAIPWLLPACLVVIGVLSWLSFTWLETPARKWLNGFARGTPWRTRASDVF